MEEFKKDLIEVFNKHNILVLKDSVSVIFTPLYVDTNNNITKREVTFKFSQIMNDMKEAKKHADEYGCIVRGC